MITLDRSTGMLILSIMVFLLSLFVYKLGSDIRANRLKANRKTRKEQFINALKHRWICTNDKKEP